jgi:hypothetical protein
MHPKILSAHQKTRKAGEVIPAPSAIRLFVLFVLGVLVTAFAGAVYYGLERALSDYDDHDRGMWEGAAIVYSIALGSTVANRIARRKGQRACRAEFTTDIDA